MPSVYEEDNYDGRVKYVVQWYLRGTRNGRHFDACFEQGDGDAVVVAIVRRARKNPRLWNAIANQRGEKRFPHAWLMLAEQHRDVPTSELKDLARKMREESKR